LLIQTKGEKLKRNNLVALVGNFLRKKLGMRTRPKKKKSKRKKSSAHKKQHSGQVFTKYKRI